MNRPKKKKASPVEEVSEGGKSEDDVPPNPASAEPEPEPLPPLPPASPEPVPEEAAQFGDDVALRGVQRARARLTEADKRLKVVERRWEKKMHTYHLSGKYSTWDVQSAVACIEMRLYEADKELGEARALHVHRRGRWLRWRSFYLLKKRFDFRDEPEGSRADELLALRPAALVRCEPCAKVEVNVARVGSRHL